jgi:hypothetical protein
MKETSSLAISWCSVWSTRPTQGAEHFPMSASKQGRFALFAALNTPDEQERIG